MNLNTATIAGRLVRDPELKSLPSGQSVCTFSLATNRRVKDREETEYHNIVVFGAQAEATAKYLTKGSIALVVGRLQTRSWEKDGVKQYRTEIVSSTVEFGPKNGSKTETPPQDPTRPAYYPTDDIKPEDIPF